MPIDMKCVAPEYELCPRCKNADTMQCLDCTTLHGMMPILIYGVAIGTQPVYYHHNFEPRVYNLDKAKQGV